MAKNVSVLYVSSEVNPFAKTGGLADVANSLPQAIFNSGQEIRVVMPKYGFISERRSRLHEVIRLKDIEVPMNGTVKKMNVRVGVLPDTRVQVYFIDNEEYFKRDSLYTDPKTQSDYADNQDRFAFFGKAVFEMLKRLGWQPTLIHCNDWHAGLIPLYLKTHYKNDPFFANTKTLFTIHNIAYQGAFPETSATALDIPATLLKEASVIQDGKINFLKAGVTFADYVSTVSNFYAEEIKTNDEISGGMKSHFAKKVANFSGIVNGIDYKVWNPETDKLVPANYSSEQLIGKNECKKALVEKLGLPFSETTPLIGIVTRLAEQKGIDLILETLPIILQKDVQFILVGHGEEKFVKDLETLKNKFPGKMGLVFSFDEHISHMVYAGSDIYLMPSKFEPCGLSQMYAMRYGSIPVVRETGGLADTVKDAKDGSEKSASGFKFKVYSKDDFTAAIDNALKAYQKKALWSNMINNAMGTDLSWNHSAAQYISLYKKILKDK